jgi:hypothetical protein
MEQPSAPAPPAVAPPAVVAAPALTPAELMMKISSAAMKLVPNDQEVRKLFSNFLIKFGLALKPSLCDPENLQLVIVFTTSFCKGESSLFSMLTNIASVLGFTADQNEALESLEKKIGNDFYASNLFV